MPSKYQVSPRSILRSRGALSSSNPFSIISFGVVSMVITLLGVITASFAVALALGAINSPSAFATEPSPTTTSASSDVTLNLSSAVSIRVLDSTATTDISKLSFDFTPTAAGVSSTSRAVVEVGTSNETGYKLYMQSDYQDSNSNYTTSLVNADSDIPSSIGTIPTAVSGAGTTVKNYWNYYNPLISPTTGSAIGTSLIPAYGSPDKIAQGFTTTAADYTNVDITVGIDSTIAAGTYNNQLLFTAIANANPINYSLYYEQNLPAGADASTLANFPSNQTASSVATSYNFTIPATTPTLEGYTLTNYLDLDTASEPTPTTYSPGDTVTVLADTSSSTSNNDGEKTLRANWTINSPTVTVTYDNTMISDVTISASSANPLRSTTAATVNYGDTVTIGYTVNTGYSLDSITASYVDNITGATIPLTITNNSFTMPDGDVSIAMSSSINQYTLTVNPNGGTWNGSTSSQSFTQDYHTTKNISNPTATPTYTITYNGNSQGASYSADSDIASRSFSSWSLSGSGTFVSSTGQYTFEAGNGTLTANYGDASYTIQSISKAGHSCSWHIGSASGAVASGTVSLSGDVTYVAVCTPNTYTISISNSHTSTTNASGTSISSTTIAYGGSTTIKVTPSSGYYLSSVSCPSGYTCTGYHTGSSYTGQQTVTITNNNTTSGGTISFTGTLKPVTPSSGCSNATVGSTYTANGVTYIKLADNNCYTKNSQGTADFNNAANLCPSGTSVPSKSNWDNLISIYGSTPSTFFSSTGFTAGKYQTSTSCSDVTGCPSTSYSWMVYNYPSVVKTYGNNYKTNSWNVVCIVN